MGLTIGWVPRQSKCASATTMNRSLSHNQIRCVRALLCHAERLVITCHGFAVPCRHEHIGHQIMSSLLAVEVNPEDVGHKKAILLLDLRDAASTWHEGASVPSSRVAV